MQAEKDIIACKSARPRERSVVIYKCICKKLTDVMAAIGNAILCLTSHRPINFRLRFSRLKISLNEIKV